MKLLKNSIIIGILMFILAFQITPLSNKIRTETAIQEPASYHSLNEIKTSSGEGYNTINEMFDETYNEFNTQGFFSQSYESSLQATYYALYVLDALDNLDIINHSAVVNFIMACYDEASERFTDSYAQRYLHTNFSNSHYLEYFQFPSLLEVNCFAVLSLNILGELNRIENQQFIDFIWSCLNLPNERGFIGQPYTSELQPYFKVSTADDTYYAILALEVLGDEPSSHPNQWLHIEEFIKDLQNTNLTSYFYGAFYNDENDDLDSLDNLDITLLTSYYCLRGLKEIDAIMQFGAFHQFLEKHYDDDVPYFKLSSVIFPENKSNIIGTAVGLQLSDLSGYLSINRSGILNFILNNRNSWGLWNSSTAFRYHELIDTFQVIRALAETSELIHLSPNEKDQIATSIKNLFEQPDSGFSLLSKDYSSMHFIHTIVKSAVGIYRRAQYDAQFKQEIYDLILSNYENSFGDHLFAGAINMFQSSQYENGIIKSFRSRPIEYCNPFYTDTYNQIGFCYSHQTTYYALETLYYIGMLGAFGNQYDLSEMITNIIETQFLSSSYSNYGGFIVNPVVNDLMSDDQKNNHIFLEYSYYAFRLLEILAEELEITIEETGLNKNALVSFVDNTAGGSAIHYDPWYSTDLSTILRNTYYMVYILNATAPERLDVPKIRNYVVQNLNYSDIKNIYYSYKISEFLDLKIDFDTQLTNQLLRDIYDEEMSSFYLTSDRKIFSDEVFLWICDMAPNDPINITAIYPQSVELGTSFNVTVYLNNIMLEYFGPDVSVKFDASFDHITLTREPDMSYKGEVYISNIAENYPVVTGEFRVSGGPIQGIITIPITIQTTSDKFQSPNNSEKTSDSQKLSENGEIIEPSVHTALPVMITLIALPSIVIFISSKSKQKSKNIPLNK